LPDCELFVEGGYHDREFRICNVVIGNEEVEFAVLFDIF
jgi:hypothetical protein